MYVHPRCMSQARCFLIRFYIKAQIKWIYKWTALQKGISAKRDWKTQSELNKWLHRSLFCRQILLPSLSFVSSLASFDLFHWGNVLFNITHSLILFFFVLFTYHLFIYLWPYLINTFVPFRFCTSSPWYFNLNAFGTLSAW